MKHPKLTFAADLGTALLWVAGLTVLQRGGMNFWLAFGCCFVAMRELRLHVQDRWKV